MRINTKSPLRHPWKNGVSEVEDMAFLLSRVPLSAQVKERIMEEAAVSDRDAVANLKRQFIRSN